MNKIITILVIAFSTVLSAQDEIGKGVLDKLSSTTKSYSNITIGFDFIFENSSLNITERKSGTLVIQRNNFLLEMEDQIIINDGETQWIYLTDMNEVQIIKHDPEDEMMNPKNLFVIYEKGYKYKYVGVKTENRKRLHIINLFPEESNSFIKVELMVNAAQNELHRIILFDKNGGTYTYLVTAFKSNSKTMPQFTFNPADYPDVEVIDLR
jgi:outer membrane lipoprotein-sorting protein